jgi:hypothetical protein
MGRQTRCVGLGAAVAMAALLLVVSGPVSAAKSKQSKFHQVLITFSGSGTGNYSSSVPEDDVGDSPGTCTAASNSYSTVDHYTFEWSEKLTFPDGIGSYVKQYKVGGTDVSTQKQGNCTNGFGNPVGGNSFSCTTRWNPLPSSDTEYPMVVMSGGRSHLVVKVSGGIIANGAPSGTNCTGQPLGMSVDSYSFEGLKGSVSFTAPKLEHKRSVSKKVGSNTSLNCSSTTCDSDTCKNDQTSPGDVPTTCNTRQSFTGEIKVQLVK